VKPSVWAIFLLFACLYLLSLGRGFYSSDGDVMFQTTAALVERHSWVLEPDPGLPQIVAGQDGRYYSKYDPGLPLIGVPFYVTGDWIARINHAHRYRLAATFYLMIPALSAAGTLAALAVLAGAKRRLVVLMAGLATPLWPYARVLFAEATLACALTVAVAILCRLAPMSQLGFQGRTESRSGSTISRFHRTGDPMGCPGRGTASPLQLTSILNLFAACSPLNLLGRGGDSGVRRYTRTFVVPLFAGIVLGMGILVRAALAIYVPPLLYLVAARTPARQGRAVTARLVAFVAGLLPFVVILLWANAQRFGDPFQSGYRGEGFTTPVWKGVFGLLFSPGKGILFYAPPLVLSVILWPRFRRSDPALANFLALAWGVALIVYGTWWAWYGGWCWGPRFLVPLIPLSCLPLAALPDRRSWRVLAGIALGVGIGVQLLGVLTDVTVLYSQAAGSGESRYDPLHFAPRHALLIGAVRRLLDGQTEPLAVFHLKGTGLPPTWTIGIPLLLVVGVIAGGWAFFAAGRRLRFPR
jgi:hypothetical protein